MATITAGILCDFAQVRQNLLFVMSGGVTRRATPQLPTALGVMAAIMMEIPPHEQTDGHKLIVAVKNNNTAETLARVTQGVQMRGARDMFPGESVYLPAVVDLRRIRINDYGAYDVTIGVDDEPGPHLTFYIIEPRVPGEQ